MFRVRIDRIRYDTCGTCGMEEDRDVRTRRPLLGCGAAGGALILSLKCAMANFTLNVNSA
jgi:hypothetical protein